MRKLAPTSLVALCVASLGYAIPSGAGSLGVRVASPPCTAMGLSATSLAQLFGSTVATKAMNGNICIVATNPETVYVEVSLYPVTDKAAFKSYSRTFVHAKRLGALGAGAKYVAYTGGAGDALYLRSGNHFAILYASELPSTGDLISLARIIYTALS